MEFMRYKQVDNPTHEDRMNMVRQTLKEADREDEFLDVTRLLKPKKGITKIIKKNEGRGIKVCIIGGGLAGLSAAFELRKVGVDITIYEMEKERIGGRVYTHYFDKKKKLYGELGAMRIPVSHEAVWHYIDLFKLNTKPFIEKNKNGYIYIRGKREKNDLDGKNVIQKIYKQFNLKEDEKNKPWKDLIKKGVLEEFYNIEEGLRKEILEIKKEYSNEIENLDKLSIRDALKGSGLSEGAIELISCLDPLLGSFYYNGFIESLMEQYTVDYEYRYFIEGGMVKLPLAFYNSLMDKNPNEYRNVKEENINRVKWENDCYVTSICKESDKKVSIGYKKGKSSKINTEKFDYVICTIPFTSLRTLEIKPMFSKEKMQAIKEISYVKSQKVLFLCKERFWKNQDDERLGGSSVTDLVSSTIWYPNSKENDGKSKSVLLASYNLNNDSISLGGMENKLKTEMVKTELERVHGIKNGYLDKIVESYKTIEWINEPGINGAFAHYMPNQKSLFSYYAKRPEFENHVFFAGEHISQTHGWMQGALSTGTRAAYDVALNIKKNK
ncbi:flavin monoamine oxidase family protein [Clostridium chrysemydis]|uniref:flavin monoamine oxidase family protein n=1 Tax=Clostridium chrysemydis TaxID=2665504 RepID=UPI0018839544|nr:NAD(P)/FAD-dependent oxidoreductase [Clostridium chrysemydis]